MEKIVYYDLELKEFVTENKVRYLLFDLELGDIYHNIIDYKEGLLNLESQLDLVRSSIYSDIKDVIKKLKENWQIEIKMYKEVE